MKITAAIKQARRRVTIVPQGRGQYALHTFDPARNATWVSNSTTWARACASRREALIREALDALGVEEPDVIANHLTERDWRWDALVREYARETQRRRVQDNAASGWLR